MQRVNPWRNRHSHLLRHHWIHVCAKNPAHLWESHCYCCSHQTRLLSDEGDPLDDVITGFPPGLQRSWCGVDITEQWTGGVWELSCMTCWQEQYVFTLTSVSLHYTFKMCWLETFLQFSESCFLFRSLRSPGKTARRPLTKSWNANSASLHTSHKKPGTFWKR